MGAMGGGALATVQVPPETDPLGSAATSEVRRETKHSPARASDRLRMIVFIPWRIGGPEAKIQRYLTAFVVSGGG